ncbi:MAG TPA: prepilin-type N-terminal cleavage/methylation domain-containing protein [Bacillota bacterium]|nr:prepilin-type N-terminal cleavage/methylation domain-containing protein [Bacillota bacterium]
MLRQLRRTSRQERGFTLIELLVVVVILGILAAVAIPRVLGAIERARESRAVADIRVIVSGLERYFFDHGVFPTHLGALRGVYVKSDFLFTNAHGHIYFYAVRWDAANDIHNLSQYAIGNPTNPPGDIALTNWTWGGTGERPALPAGLDPLHRGYAFGDPMTIPTGSPLTAITGLTLRPTRTDLTYD